MFYIVCADIWMFKVCWWDVINDGSNGRLVLEASNGIFHPFLFGHVRVVQCVNFFVDLSNLVDRERIFRAPFIVFLINLVGLSQFLKNVVSKFVNIIVLISREVVGTSHGNKAG